MVLEIKKYPEPVLRKKCREVKEITDEIKKLGRDMMETMKDKDGIGLAAPQVGETKRIIVVHPIQERTPQEKAAKTPLVFINPKIAKKSKKQEVMEEGCLSLPGLWLKIKRAREVEMKALNIEGREVKIKTAGLFARVLQHEIDHLDGILLIDRLPFWQKLKLKHKIQHG